MNLSESSFTKNSTFNSMESYSHHFMAFIRTSAILLLGISLLIPVISQEDAEAESTGPDIVSDRLEFEYEGDVRRLRFIGNVIMTEQTMVVKCDRADILINRQPEGEDSDDTNNEAVVDGLGQIEFILATGNVEIEQMGTRALAGKAEIYPLERRLVLEESPRIIDERGTVSGHRIVFLQGERKIRIESGEDQPRSRISLKDIAAIGNLLGEEPIAEQVENEDGNP